MRKEWREPNKYKKGMTLVEIIVALAVAAVVMSAIGMFFISNTRMTQDVFGNAHAQTDLQYTMTVLTNIISELPGDTVFESGVEEKVDYSFTSTLDASKNIYIRLDKPELKVFDTLAKAKSTDSDKSFLTFEEVDEFTITPVTGSKVFNIEITGINPNSGKLLTVKSDVGIRNKR